MHINTSPAYPTQMLREHRKTSKSKETDQPKEETQLPHVTVTGSWRMQSGGSNKSIEKMKARTLNEE